MKPGIPQEVIDQVREAADIVEVIGRYVTLVQAGSTFKGLCPFHPEKTPSFIVNPDRRIFKCFGCGEGGNVFSFLMKHAGLSFPEAVLELAQGYGIPLPRPDLSPNEAKKVQAKERALKVMTAAADYFQSLLWSRQGSLARALSPGAVHPQGGGQELRAGLGRGQMGRAAQPFRPGEGQPGPFGADRADQPPRQRERPLRPFPGPADLPHPGPPGPGGGLWRPGSGGGPGAQVPQLARDPAFQKRPAPLQPPPGRPAIRKRSQVVVVEGYFDCLSLAAQGITNTVATMGTALTGAQVRAMRGLGIDVVLVYDGDFCRPEGSHAGPRDLFRGGGPGPDNVASGRPGPGRFRPPARLGQVPGGA